LIAKLALVQRRLSRCTQLDMPLIFLSILNSPRRQISNPDSFADRRFLTIARL